MNYALKRFIIYILIVISPFLLMIIVNSIMGTSHHKFEEKRCTRYCHDKGCIHYVDKNRRNSIQGVNSNYTLRLQNWVEKIYMKNIELLHHNRMGLSYAVANILIYVIIIPFLCALLLWNLIRKNG